MEAAPEFQLPLFTIILVLHLVSMVGCLVGLDTRVDGDPYASIFFSAWLPAAVLFAALITLSQLVQAESWFLLPIDSLLRFSSLTLWLLAAAQLWILVWLVPKVPFILRLAPYLGLVVAAFFLRH